jgi:hypothetical protein
MLWLHGTGWRLSTGQKKCTGHTIPPADMSTVDDEEGKEEGVVW